MVSKVIRSGFSTMMLVLILILITLMTLSGCAQDSSQNNGQSKPPASEPGLGQGKGKEEEEKDTQGSQSPERAKQGKIKVYVEGLFEARDATLVRSEQMGYSLYVLEGFQFAAEEPGNDVVFSEYDPEFFVRIQQLAPDTDLAQLETSQTQAYASMGKVKKIDPQTLFLEEFRDAKLCLHVDILKQGFPNVETSLNYVVKDVEGTLYAFFFHLPLKEASEGITPSLWAMAATLENE